MPRESISSNILSDRLKRLEDRGIISSIPHPDSGRRKLYYLLPKGKDLIYVIIQLGRWGEKHLDDVVDIPEDRRNMLVNHPDELIQMTLRNLEKWETTFLGIERTKKLETEPQLFLKAADHSGSLALPSINPAVESL